MKPSAVMNRMKPLLTSYCVCLLCFVATASTLFSNTATATPIVSKLAREAVEIAVRKSGREVTERAARESLEQAAETAVSKYGPQAAQAVADGGIELLEAAGRHGDDLIRAAVLASPAGRRALALEPSRLLPLVRELGPEALELEVKTPGLARRVFVSFGEDVGRQIAKQVPSDDLPRLLKYGERAESPQTRKMLFETYQKEGRSLFERIPASLVLASGLTAAMLYGTHRMTEPFAAVSDSIATQPEHAQTFIYGMLGIAGVLGVIALVFVLGAFRLTPWHATSAQTGSRTREDASQTHAPPSPATEVTEEKSGVKS